MILIDSQVHAYEANTRKLATRTARLIGHGRLWRTGAFMMVAWFTGKCTHPLGW
jgi:hypothetical protein